MVSPDARAHFLGLQVAVPSCWGLEGRATPRDSTSFGKPPLFISQCRGCVVSAGCCWAGRTEKQDLVTLRGRPHVAMKLGQR